MKILEKDFQKTVIELAQRTGWKVAHFRNVKIQRANGQTYYQLPVQADGRGLPDLFCANDKKHKAFWIELKSQKGKLSKEQEQWINTLINSGQTVYVFRPSDWDKLERIFTE